MRASVTKKLTALTSIREEDFDRFFDVHDLKAEEWNDIDGLEVRPVFSPHPVETAILFFRALGSDGPRTYAHLADIGSLSMFRKWITADPEAPGLSQALYDRVEREYLQPADVKKLDAGGGMIHGDPTDFRNDASGKIILSHLARPLTTEEKEIGSGATFGMIDTLIPGHQEYLRRSAVSYLEAFFPTAPEWEIRMLANNPLQVFNPETILLKRGDTPRTMYLILSGSMEMLCADQGREWVLSAGSLAGEIAGMTRSPSRDTLRALNFVQALCIPCDLYLEFVKRNGLYARLRRLQNRRGFLQSTWLLGDSVSCPVQTGVARAMRLRRRPAWAEVAPENDSELVLIQKGTACLLLGKEIVETLGPGDFFNEGGALFGTSGIFQVQAQEAVALYCVPGKLLRDIPIVRWKLQETYERRMYRLLCPKSNHLPVFHWREEYATHIREMDDHHKEIFAIADALYKAVRCCELRPALDDSLRVLISYAEMHFSREEELMCEHGFPEYEAHLKLHQQLLAEIRERKARRDKGEDMLDSGFMEFLKDWIVHHLLTEDRKYGPFLNEKGVR